MSENGHRPGRLPQRGVCPVWCTDCEEGFPEEARRHRGPRYAVRGYHDWSGPAGSQLSVRAEWLDKHPAERGHDPVELEQPTVSIRDEHDRFVVDIPPAQARLLAEAIVRAADSITAATST